MKKYFRFHELGADRSHYIELLGPELIATKSNTYWVELFSLIIGSLVKSRNLETRYGIHDVSFATNTDTIWGFSSYEVVDWDGLMKEWKEILTLVGFRVGNYFVREPEEQDRQL